MAAGDMAVFSTYLFPEIEPVDPFRIRSAVAVGNMIHVSVFFNVIHAVSAGCMIHVSVFFRVFEQADSFMIPSANVC